MRRSPSETCLLNSVQLTSLSRRLAGKLFQIRGPAAAKHLSPKRLWALSPRIRPEAASRTFSGEMNIDGQIARYFAWQHFVWQSWIQLVVWPAANEVDAILVWCVHDVWLLWSALPQHSAPTVLAAWVCRSLRTAVSSSPKWPILCRVGR